MTAAPIRLRLIEAHGRKAAPIFLGGSHPIPLMLQKVYCRNRIQTSANFSPQEKELLLFTYKTLPAVTFLCMWIPNIVFSPDLLKKEITNLHNSALQRISPTRIPNNKGRIEDERMVNHVDKKCEIAATTAALEYSVMFLAHHMD